MCTIQAILCLMFHYMIVNSSHCANDTPGTLCVIDGDSYSNPTCRNGDPCEINCGENQCKDKEINAEYATDVTITCTGSDACKGNSDIICGTGDCILYCNSAKTSCEDATIINPNERAHSFQCLNYCSELKGDTDTYTQNPTPSPTFNPTPAPTANPTMPTMPTSMPTNNPTPAPTAFPTHNPTIPITSTPPTNIPTSNPSIIPTNNPSTINPTVIPTESPTTLHPIQSPSQSPSYSPSVNISPTSVIVSMRTTSPIIDGIRADHPTVAPVVNENGELAPDQTEVKVSMDDTDWYILGIIIGVSLVSICIICGIIIFCKQYRNKRKRIQNANFESDAYRKQSGNPVWVHHNNRIEIGVNELHINGHQFNEEGTHNGKSSYTPEGIVTTDQTQYLSQAQREAVHVTIGNDSAEIVYDEFENESDPSQYLSKTQQNQLAVTAGGPEYGIRCELQASNENNYLSKAQKNEREITAGKEFSKDRKDSNGLNENNGNGLNENKNKNIYLSKAQQEHVAAGAPHINKDSNYVGLGNDLVTIGGDMEMHGTDQRTSDDEVLQDVDSMDTPMKFVEVSKANAKSPKGYGHLVENSNEEGTDENDEMVEENHETIQ